jgi:hypothetical protein
VSARHLRGESTVADISIDWGWHGATRMFEKKPRMTFMPAPRFSLPGFRSRETICDDSIAVMLVIFNARINICSPWNKSPWFVEFRWSIIPLILCVLWLLGSRISTWNSCQASTYTGIVTPTQPDILPPDES